MKKVVSYPLSISNGRVNLNPDPAAELDVLLEYPTRRRVRDREYGIDFKMLQQSSLNMTRLAPVALLELRTKFLEYVKNTQLESARIYKDKVKPRTLFIQVTYRNENNQTFIRNFERDVKFK